MNFDALSRHYRWLEFVLAGNKLQRCRTAFLDRVLAARRVLIAGEGNGRFLKECRLRLPKARTIVVDASARMLRSARECLTRRGLDPEGVEFVHADAIAWKTEEQAFDLIVTHFFFDCFPPEELKRIVGNLALAAAPGAAWLIADFQIPARGLRRCRARLIHAMMYAFFRFVTQLPARRLTSPDVLLESHDFALLERRTTEWGLLHTDLWRRPDSLPGKPRRDIPL